jgi:hypothetical protein
MALVLFAALCNFALQKAGIWCMVCLSVGRPFCDSCAHNVTKRHVDAKSVGRTAVEVSHGIITNQVSSTPFDSPNFYYVHCHPTLRMHNSSKRL